MCARDDDGRILKLTTHIIFVQSFRYFLNPKNQYGIVRLLLKEGNFHVMFLTMTI